MATLSDLGKKVRNTITRQSQIFLLTETVGTGSVTNYSIDEVDTSDDHFVVYDEDLSSDPEFAVGEKFYVNGSSGNDKVYTVDSVTTGDLDGEGDTDDSQINVVESVEDSTADGSIYVGKNHVWNNLGRVMNASFESSPITSSMDQDGRESSELFEITLAFAMMQTSNVELSLMEQLALPDPDIYEFYLNGHTLYMSGSNRITTTEMNDATTNKNGTLTFGTGANELDDPDGLLLENVLLKPGPEIDLSGEESSVSIEATGKVEQQELNDLDTTQKIIISYE